MITAGVRCLRESLRQAGAHVDEEFYVAPLAERLEDGTTAEAKLDLVVGWPGSCSKKNFDVTLRCAHARRYRAASTDALYPLREAEKHKHDRYGVDVCPIAMSPYGRIGVETMVHLRAEARQATVLARIHPIFPYPPY